MYIRDGRQTIDRSYWTKKHSKTDSDVKSQFIIEK